MDPLPCMLVRDNVRLVRPLGQGGMGQVWVADHLALNAQVAVKFLDQRLATENTEAIHRFHQEASASAQIKSRHVVRTFDHGVTNDGTAFIVMELLDGETLEDTLERRHALPLADVRLIGSQLARALASAHKVGIVHRDIKPDNIFLSAIDDALELKVFDFGIAKQTQIPKVSKLTNSGSMMGTPAYMSPEQMMDAGEVDHKADLWAFGVVVYEMITGRVPFDAMEIGQLCKQLLVGEFPPASSLVHGVPRSLDAWIARALHSDAHQRFQSAQEMGVALMRAIPSADGYDQVATGEFGMPQEQTFDGSASDTERKSGAPPIALIVAAAGLLIALFVLVALVVTGGATESEATATATVSAAPSPAPAAPPARADPTPSASATATPSASASAAAPAPDVKAAKPMPRPAPKPWHNRRRVKPAPRVDPDDPGF